MKIPRDPFAQQLRTASALPCLLYFLIQDGNDLTIKNVPSTFVDSVYANYTLMGMASGGLPLFEPK